MSRLSALAPEYDLLIIGGGITGAGLLLEAARSGMRALLVEARDFGSGTSSYSSKLVHGGLRYLKSGHWRLTLESVRERERLLRDIPDLVQRLSFVMPLYRRRKPSRATLQAGLWLYDRMGGRAQRSSHLTPTQTQAAAGVLLGGPLRGAMQYGDAVTDDARLVWRLLAQAQAEGGQALNYVRATDLLRAGDRICGARLRDAVSGEESREVRAQVVIDAAGVWAAEVAASVPQTPRIRPLRGSHLLFPYARLPLSCAVGWLHPQDGRPVFAFPWQGAVLVGTTDLDHREDLWQPRVTAQEVAYLLQGLDAVFPDASLRPGDALCGFAGLRPVIDDGRGGDPSAVSRESALWQATGFVGITGGKLTTFRTIAREALQRASEQLPTLRLSDGNAPLLPTAPPEPVGEAIAGTPWNWAQLEQRADEQVLYPADLLLRRTRLGLVLPDGGAALLPELLRRLGARKGWDEVSVRHYQEDWHRLHALPGVPA